MGIQETVTLVNRTTGKNTRVLNVMFDGFSMAIQPGDNVGFPKDAVEHARQQNPVRGSMHPNNPFDYKSLVGVKGRDNCEPVIEDPKADELMDRKKMRGIGRTGKAILGDPATAFESRVQGAIDGEDASRN